ncbi:phosphatidylethanolamine N-methyltransferase, partial [Mortierella sp. AD094]
NRYLYTGRDLGLGEAEEGVENHAGKGDGEVYEEEVVWVEEKEICRGRVVFVGDKLPWFQGTFEFRYHHHGRYNVMAYTAPFEIAYERFLMINETIAQRIVKGIQLMYGIEFAWEVVAVDMSCLHLALRIFTASRALAPFSAVSDNQSSQAATAV